MAAQLERLKRVGLTELRERYPELSLAPSYIGETVLTGVVDFQTTHPQCRTFEDAFSLEIKIPDAFPASIPEIREIGGRIDPKFHRLKQGALCLGSPIRLRLLLAENSTLLGFVESCVLPYLVGFSIFERTGQMPFGELKHGSRGLLDDYRSLVRVSDDLACLRLLELLQLKEALANKRICPCGSGSRLGRCHSRQLKPLRRIAPRSWYAETFKQLISTIQQESNRNCRQAALPAAPLQSH